ncbi:MAG: glycosyltransferase family 9 protein, partial [Gammaproteobacteria bacterium]
SRDEINSVSVVFHKQIGDLVLIEPLLARIAYAIDRPVSLATRAHLAPVVSLMGSVAEPWKRGTRSDLLLALDTGSETARRALLMPARHKVVLAMHQSYLRWYHRLVFDEQKVSSQLDRYRALYYWQESPLGDDLDDFRPPRLKRPPEDWKGSLTVTKGGYLIAHATSAWRKKCWSQDHWRDALKAIQARYGLPILVTGGAEEWEVDYAEELVDKVGGDCTSLAGKTNFQEYLYLLSRAACVVSVDGSAAHLAHAFKTPSVTIFGPANYRHWHFEDEVAKVLHPEAFGDDSKAIDNIPAAACIAAVEQLLGSGP